MSRQVNPTSPALPSAPIRSAVYGRVSDPPPIGGIWVRKHDLAIGDIYTECVGNRSNGLPRWESSRITSLDKVQGTMQITFGANETKTVKPRDLSVIAGPKIEAAKANPALLKYQGGRHVWSGEVAGV